jgi:hypothetical protein
MLLIPKFFVSSFVFDENLGMTDLKGEESFLLSRARYRTNRTIDLILIEILFNLLEKRFNEL